MSTKSTFNSYVLYERTPVLKFDLEYYLNHHIPMCLNYWKPYGVLDCRVVETDATSEYAYVVTMMWEDEGGWIKANAQKEEMANIMGDVEKFTNGVPKFVVGKVVL
jgi:hypothetical protein